MDQHAGGARDAAPAWAVSTVGFRLQERLQRSPLPPSLACWLLRRDPPQPFLFQFQALGH